MRVVSSKDADALLATLDVVDVVAEALARYSAGEAHVPARVAVTAGRPSRESLVMPGYMANPAVLGIKVVNGFSASFEDPTLTSAVVVVFDTETGAVDGIVEGTRLTAVRTAAMTRLAFRFAAPEEVGVVAMIGSGVQAHAHAERLAEDFPHLRELRVYSRKRDRVAQFVQDTSTGRFDVLASTSAEAAVTGADVVVTATTAHEPVFEDRWLASGALVCGIGTHSPDDNEIPAATVARAASVIVDTRIGGVHGAGDISKPLAAGTLAESAIVELGELVLGKRSLDRRNGSITVFKSVGTAAADLPLAAALVRLARETGVGQEIDFA